MEDITKDNKIRSIRPDIASCMDAYNKHYGIINDNIPDEINISSSRTIHCRCKHGHDFSRSAYKMNRLSVDKNNNVCCPSCISEGLQYRANSMSLLDFVLQHDDKKHLLDEWDYKKNSKLKFNPSTISYGVNRRVWWICPNRHSYDKSVYKRTVGGGCPVCSGARLVVGQNDLLSQYPIIAKDWDVSKNNCGPHEIAKHSNRRVYWKCHKCGHEWQTKVSSRTSSCFPGNCPKCINHGMSRIEMCIYLAVKKHFPDAQYRARIDKTEFDVFIPSIQLVIEYDGIYFHRDLKRRKLHKDVVARHNGLRFFRIEEVDEAGMPFLFENDTLKIHTNKNTKYIEICSRVLQHMRDDFDIDVDTTVDDNLVYQAFSEMSIVTDCNSLATKYPDIAAEWHPTKNGDLKPEHMDACSHVKAWWVCNNCGSEFQKPICSRTTVNKKTAGCAFCTGQRRRVGFNDLETLYPGIRQFWCDKENESIKMAFEECAPTSVKYTYWNFGEGIKKMQIRNAIHRYHTLVKNKK